MTTLFVMLGALAIVAAMSLTVAVALATARPVDAGSDDHSDAELLIAIISWPW